MYSDVILLRDLIAMLVSLWWLYLSVVLGLGLLLVLLFLLGYAHIL